MAMGAAVAQTYGTIADLTGTAPAAVGQREDLTDIISRIDPAEVPFYSNLTKGGQKATLHEWQNQELGAPARTAQPEGYEAAFAAPTATVRLTNAAMILARSWIVSGTLDVVDKAGRDRETVYQRTLKGLELRRDLESTLLRNTAQVSATDPRTMGGFAAWMVHGFFGTGANQAAGDGTASAGNIPVPDLAATPADDALTFPIIDVVLEAVYNAGGKPSQLCMTPNAKRAFSNLNNAGASLAAANRYTQASKDEAVYIGGVGFYVSDYGDLEVQIDRFAPGGSALGGAWLDDGAVNSIEAIFIVDRRHVQCVSLPGRSFMSEPLSKTGDAVKGHVLFEGTLRNSAPKAHGLIVMPTLA